MISNVFDNELALVFVFVVENQKRLTMIMTIIVNAQNVAGLIKHGHCVVIVDHELLDLAQFRQEPFNFIVVITLLTFNL